MRRSIALALLASIPIAGCNVSTEPVVNLDCTTLALTYNSAANLVTTPSGLQYRDVVVGPGAPVTSGSRLITHYAACVGSGQVFSEAIGPSRFIFTVGQGQVFPGLDEGVVGMKLGGRREMVVPADLGYGTTGSPGGFQVPNETIIITVDAIGFQ